MKIDEVTRTDQQLPRSRVTHMMSKGALSKLHPIAGAIEAKALQNLGRNRDALLAMERSWRSVSNMQLIMAGFQHFQAMSELVPRPTRALFKDRSSRLVKTFVRGTCRWSALHKINWQDSLRIFTLHLAMTMLRHAIRIIN